MPEKHAETPTKICHLTSVHAATDARIFHKECKTLAQAGYEVVLIGPNPNSTMMDGVEIRAIPIAKNRITRRLFGIWHVFLKAFNERAAVYHLHDPELIPVGILLRLTRRARVVYDMHEYYSEVRAAFSSRYTRRFWRSFWHLWLEALPVRYFDMTVFPTEALAGEFHRVRKSVTVLNLPTLEPGPNSDAEVQPQRFDVVVVGTVSPPRMQFILQVAEELQVMRGNSKWLFLGLHPKAREWLLANTEHSDLVNNHVAALERVPHTEVFQYLRSSRVGFNYHPPEKRFLVAIPMKVFEYMLAGIPAVSTALPELERLLSSGKNASLVYSGDPREYAEAIAALLTNPEMGQVIGLAGQRTITEQLNWEQTEAPKLLQAYREMLL